MKAIRKRPGEGPEVVEIENTLEALQAEVGGYIEAVTLASDVCLIVNEEGKLLELPYNVTWVDGALRDHLRGTLLLVGVDGEEFCDLPQPDFWMEQFEDRLDFEVDRNGKGSVKGGGEAC